MSLKTKSPELKRDLQTARRVKATPREIATGPIYLALAEQLRERIATGELRPGDRLPSFAEMRQLYGSTVTTVERTYGLLEKEKLIERRQGIGTFVTAPEAIATGNIGLIGCANPQRHLQVYYANLLDGVQAALEAAGKELLLLGGDGRWNREALSKVDGVLLGNVGGAEAIVQEFPPGLPYLALLSPLEGATSVVADEQGGTRQAIRHLLELGHRRIACVMEQQPPSPRRRLAAYVETLQEAGIKPNPRWLCPVEEITYRPRTERLSYMDWGYESMRGWLDNGWAKTGCTALFVQNDTAAVGVLQALQEAGLRVPHDVSLVGFDGTEVCDFTRPRLTAVEVPLEKIGAKAVELLLQKIAARSDAAQSDSIEQAEEAYSIVIPTKLRSGESTGPVPK